MIGGAGQAAGAGGAGAGAGGGIGALIGNAAKQGLSNTVTDAFSPPIGGGQGGPFTQDMSQINSLLEQPAAQPISPTTTPDLLDQMRRRQQPNMGQLWQS